MEARYKYILLSNDTGERLELQDAPQGWDATKFRLVRDLTYLGILKTISVEFDFVGDGFLFMQHQRLVYGIDADVMIRVYTRTPNDFLFEGKVNMENYQEDRKFHRYKVDIIQSSFVQSFQNREDVKLNVLNNISMDRKPISPANMQEALFRGKRVFYYTNFDGSTSTVPDIFTHTLPFMVKVNGNPGVPEGYSSNSSQFVEMEELIAFYNKDNAIYTNKLNLPQTIGVKWSTNVSLIYKGVLPLPFLDFEIDDFITVWIHSIVRYNIVRIDENNNIVETYFTKDFNNTFGNFDLSFSASINVPVGHSLVFMAERRKHYYHYEDDDLIFIDEQVMWEGNDETEAFRTEITYNTLKLEISQDSVATDSTHPVLLPHELFTNLIQQMTGGVFYSEFFGRQQLGYEVDGEGAFLAITKGELLRGIPLNEVQIATSFREAFSSYSTVFCLGAVIHDKIIRVEPLDFVFNANVIGHLGEVSELVVAPTKEFMFNSVKSGYPKNEYEQENGRDEFNTTYQFSNSLKAVRKELDLVSKFMGDGYGIEFARRASIDKTGTQDSRYDDQIFFVDLIKDEAGNLMTRRLEGILYVAGIFSPETAINLRIAAGQNMLRWKKYLNIPLHRKNKEYYFQSKDKNAGLELVTALGTTIDGKDLQTGSQSYFLPEEHRFKSPITIELLFAILENPLGIVSYNYDGEKFFDFVFEVDAETDKGQAEWRMLGTKETPMQVEEDVEANQNVLKYGDGLLDFMKYGDGENDVILYQ